MADFLASVLTLLFLLSLLFVIAAGTSSTAPTSPPTSTAGRPPRRLLRTPHDFELVAADWLRFWGFNDARASPIGADGGIDVEGVRIAAQVKSWTAPRISRPLIQQISGAARQKQAAFFSLCEYTQQAISWADAADVALFRFVGYDGSVEPANQVAVQLISRAASDRSGLASAAERKPPNRERRAAARILGMIDAPDDEVLHTPLGTLLASVPGVGTATRDRLLGRLNVQPSLLLKDLGDDERAELVELAGFWYQPPESEPPADTPG